jgi:hypothetical protein
MSMRRTLVVAVTLAAGALAAAPAFAETLQTNNHVAMWAGDNGSMTSLHFNVRTRNPVNGFRVTVNGRTSDIAMTGSIILPTHVGETLDVEVIPCGGWHRFLCDPDTAGHFSYTVAGGSDVMGGGGVGNGNNGFVLKSARPHSSFH